MFHDLIQEAAIAESTVLTYIIELGPETHAFEHQIATVVKGVPIGPARMITFIAHYRRLTDPTSPAIETIKHRATEYFRLHFSIQEIAKFEKQLPSDLSKAETQELIRRMFFNRFPPLLIDGMEACYYSLIGARAISEIATPEYRAAEITLRHARDARYSEKRLPETWAAAIEATIRQNYPTPYAIADDVLDHYIETLAQLVDSDRTILGGILDRLDIPHDPIEEIRDRVRMIAEATPIEMAPPSVHGNRPLLSVNQRLGRIFSSETTIKNLASSPVTASPEDYLRSISNRVPTAFTQALSGYIQHYSDHHQSIFRGLGIHPEDFSLLQETLQIGTPDSEIRRDIDRSLISGLAKKRWEWYASLQINPAVWDINIRTFPQQPGESKTNHTRRFLGVVRSKLDATTRLAIYQQKGFHQGQVEAIERIGNQHFADLMQSDPKTAVSRAIDIFSAPDRMATYQKLGYRGGTVQWVERIYAELPDTYPTHKEKFEAALADRSRKDAEHIRILEAAAAHQSRIAKAETVRQIRIYEGEVAAYRYLGIEERDIPIIRARWPGLSDEARIEKYIGYQDRCYQYRLNSIPESEHLKFDTTHWKEGMTGKATIEVYKTELKLQKIREAEKAEAARKQEADRPAREAREKAAYERRKREERDERVKAGGP